MNCYKHGDRTAANTCSHCGNWICGECTVNVNGQLICKECVAELAGDQQGEPQGHYGYSDYYSGGFPHGYGAPKPARDVNGFFLFCLSAIPGLNYMYMGLMKKGLFYMGSFFLSIYFASYGMSFLPIITFMIWCASFFDGFNVRRRLLAGQHVEDSIDDILNFVKRNKNMLLLLLCAFVVLGLFNRLQRSAARVLGYGLSWAVIDFLSGAASLAIIVLGVYIIFKAIRRKSDDSPN